MNDAVASSMGIVAYLALFAAVGLLFLFVNLLVGRFIRPNSPEPQKGETYECGEPAVGSSFVQFDLRFYVVALLFIIFDVEVAFFFPWATVFGKATHLADKRPQNYVVEVVDGDLRLTDQAIGLYQEMGIHDPQLPTAVPISLRDRIAIDGVDFVGLRSSTSEESSAPPGSASLAGSRTLEQSRQVSDQVIKAGARQLAVVTIVDIAIFFAVLMIGFAYVWMRGDLDWVRAVKQRDPPRSPKTIESVS